MADFNSSLPVRTESPGDVIVKVADATTPSQQQAVSAAGRASTSDGANGPVTPGTVAAFSELGGGQFNATPPTLTDTQQAALQLNSSGKLLVSATFGNDTNYGTVGANTLRTAAQIGNATGAADFNYGTIGAQSLRTAAEIGNATGAADFNEGANSAQTLRVSANIARNGNELDYNYGTVGANTLRTASQIGNATGSADFNAGATGAQTLRVTANQGTANATPWNENIAQISGAAPSATNALPTQIATAGAFVSSTNPLPVTLSDTVGTPINDFKDAASIAAGASDNHDYTVTAAKTLTLTSVNGSASGKAKMLVSIETGVATGVFTTRFVQFNSTATPNMTTELTAPIQVAAGVRVRIVMTNRDNQSEDLYSTISGSEL